MAAASTQQAQQQQLPDVVIHSEEFLRPAWDVDPATFELTVFDGMMRYALYQKRVLFFRSLNGGSLSATMQLLKKSLETVLVHFFPFAGRMRIRSDSISGLELDCSGELSVKFSEASTEAALNDLGDFEPSEFCDQLCEIGEPKYPWLPDMPLLFVQVTRFSCGGLSLGIGFSHQICDGVSFWHFVNSWGQIARGQDLRHDPLVTFEYKPKSDEDVEELVKKAGIVSENAAKTEGGMEEAMKKPKRKLGIKLYKLDKAMIQQLATQATAETGSSFTTFELVAAHFWKMMAAARLEEEGAKTYSFAVLINCRGKAAALQSGYFGNAVSATIAQSSFEELRSRGIGYAATKLHEAILKPGVDEFAALLNYQFNNPSKRVFNLLGSSAFSMVVSSPRHPVYQSDFGFGKPAGVTFGVNDLDEGKLYLFPSADVGKGINAYVVLHPDAVQRLPCSAL